MSRKFAVVPVLAVACLMVQLAATSYAQQAPAGSPPASQTPATQAPAPQQPGSAQEPADEESTSRRKIRVHDYRDWDFNVGAGAGQPSGTTKNFVRSWDYLGTAGVARNANKYLGLRADFFWVNLRLTNAALEQAQAPSASNNLYAITLDPIINIPVTKKYSGYVLIGPDFLHRSGKLDSSSTVPGSSCNGFWTWWGACTINSIPLNGHFLNSSQNEFGFNFGGGVARKVRGNVEVYAEFRYLHGKHNNISTDVRPISIGIRW